MHFKLSATQEGEGGAGGAAPGLQRDDCTGISAPLYELLDTVFELGSRGFFRRQVRPSQYLHLLFTISSHFHYAAIMHLPCELLDTVSEIGSRGCFRRQVCPSHLPSQSLCTFIMLPSFVSCTSC